MEKRNDFDNFDNKSKSINIYKRSRIEVFRRATLMIENGKKITDPKVLLLLRMCDALTALINLLQQALDEEKKDNIQSLIYYKKARNDTFLKVIELLESGISHEDSLIKLFLQKCDVLTKKIESIEQELREVSSEERKPYDFVLDSRKRLDYTKEMETSINQIQNLYITEKTKQKEKEEEIKNQAPEPEKDDFKQKNKMGD